MILGHMAENATAGHNLMLFPNYNKIIEWRVHMTCKSGGNEQPTRSKNYGDPTQTERSISITKTSSCSNASTKGSIKGQSG